MRFISRAAVALTLTGCCWLLPSALFSQEGHDATPGEEHVEGEHHHKNELGLVLGGTYETEEEETLFTLGLEYVRVINRTFHMAFVVEHLSEVDAWVFVAPVHIYPSKSSELFFVLGPGLEHKSRRSGEHGSSHEADQADHPVEPEQGEDLFLWRTGLGYNFHVGERMTVAPGLDWDVVRENGEWANAIVFDVVIGFGF